MAALAGMQRRLLASGGARVRVRPMLATTLAANALSVSVPLAGQSWARRSPSAASLGRAQTPRWPYVRWLSEGWCPPPPAPSSWSADAARESQYSPVRAVVWDRAESAERSR
jgi:hypothetical protein